MTEPIRRGALPQIGREIRGTGLYAQVVEELGHRIVDGTLATGELVFADQLSQTLGVSRSVVRESLRTLSSMGLVESRPQVGTRVLPQNRWDLLHPLIITWRGRGNDFLIQHRELLELRLGIESTAARLAAGRIAPERALQLRECAQQMQDRLEHNDHHGFFYADAQFHRTLLEGAGNAVLSQFADTVVAMLTGRAMDTRPPMTSMFASSVARHIALADAIVDRDVSRAGIEAFNIVADTLREFDPTAEEPLRRHPSRASSASGHS